MTVELANNELSKSQAHIIAELEQALDYSRGSQSPEPNAATGAVRARTNETQSPNANSVILRILRSDVWLSVCVAVCLSAFLCL
jgi:hypothetical protein